MNTKLLFSGVGIIALLAGCGTSHEQIYFASEVKIPASVGVNSPLPTLFRADDHKIDMVVFGYLFEHHPWQGGEYSALFLQADDEVVTALIQQYPNHVPPIKLSTHLDLRENQAPLDKDTGKPVMILGVDVGDPTADGTVDVVGRWYAGRAALGEYKFKLKKSGDDWTIVTVK